VRNDALLLLLQQILSLKVQNIIEQEEEKEASST
jgi:hypothetical protein